MRMKRKRLAALALAGVFTLGLCVPGLAAEPATVQDEDTFLRGTFTFGPHESQTDLTDTYIYSDSYFKDSSYTANAHLATMSMQMAAASISSEEEKDYAQKNKNVIKLLDALGFQGIEVNEYYQQQMQQNTMGVAVAYKPLDDATVLLAIVPRSAGYEKEWGGNFNVGTGADTEHSSDTTNADGFQGTDGLHAGFQLARNIALEFAKNYVTDHTEAFANKTVKVWTMGYSRGGATANLIGAALADDAQTAIGLTVADEDIYDYTFGTPQTVQPTNGTDVKAEQYNGIHNYFADYDPVAMAPFAGWGFTRYGQEEKYNLDTSRKARMLRFLKNLNQNVYEIYTDASGNGDPDNFKGYTLGEGFQLTPNGKSTSQREFLEERIGHLVKAAAPRRTIYVGSYQTALSTIASFYFGEDAEVVNSFLEGAGADKTKLAELVLLLAFYDWAEQYNETENSAGQAAQFSSALDEALPPVETDSADDSYLASDEYAKLRGTVTNKDDLDGYLSNKNVQKSEYIKQTEQIVKDLLTAGLNQAGELVSKETRNKMLSDETVSGLTSFVGHFVFGTDVTLEQVTDSETLIAALQKKVDTAATLVGNAGTYMRVHNNEVILSWIRTMDSYYDDPVVPSHSSGSHSATSHAVRTDATENGSVELSSSNAKKGATVKLTVTPKEGYVLDSLTVTDKNGTELELADMGNGCYTFVMPNSNVTVCAAFAEEQPAKEEQTTTEKSPYDSFSDLRPNEWYRNGVEYALKNGLMSGISDTAFAPNDATSRAMAVTILWRLSGSPVVSSAVGFSDVSENAWYTEAVRWAASTGIAAGYSDGRFGVDDIVTREQMVAMLYRYALMQEKDVSVGEDTNILSYDDANTVATYAIAAMQWACGTGVVSGMTAENGGMLLAPKDSTTRAQMAAIMMRFCMKYTA